MSSSRKRYRALGLFPGAVLSTIGCLRRTRAGRAECGQAVVEMALVLPVLLLLVFGIFKGGVIYNNYIQLTNATDAGARYFSLERDQSGTCAATVAQVAASSGGLALANVTITITDPTSDSGDVYTSTANTGASPSGTCPPTLASGDEATVAATYPCDLTIYGINFVPGGCMLKASATESMQ